MLLLFVAERMLGEHAGRTERIAMAAIVIGVICVGLCAPPLSHTHTSERATVTIVLVVLGRASQIPYALRAIHRSRAELTMCAAGLAFAWSAIATKLAADDLSHRASRGGGRWCGAWPQRRASAVGRAQRVELAAGRARRSRWPRSCS